MNGFVIVTQQRPTPPRKQPLPTARRPSAGAGRRPVRKPVAARKPPARPRGKVLRYRPNYWLVAALGLVFAFLAVAFMVTIAILWSLVGPLTTAVMVLIYAATMYVLWRVGLSRL